MYLHEEILLLSLKESNGKVDWKAGMYTYAMAGALIAELLLDKRIAISGDKKKLVRVVNPNLHDNAVLNEALELIKDAKRPKNVQHWVAKLAGLKKLKQKTATGLCRQGILKEDEGKILFVFPTKNFPELNPEPERQLVARLKDAIFGDGEIDVRTGILISLAHPSGILSVPFGNKELRQRKKRIKDITSGELIGEATGAAIEAMQAAMTVTAIMPAITAASAGSAAGGGNC